MFARSSILRQLTLIRQLSIEKILRHGRIRVNGQWLVGDLLLPSLRDALLLFGVGHAVGFEEFHEVARIVASVGLALGSDRLWIRRVLAILRSRQIGRAH